MTHATAIVGMACEYPGARSPHELWANALASRRAFRRMPRERLSLDDYFAEDRDAPDKTYGARAAVIEGYRFDRVGFRISAEAYRSADLTHWLALDVAARALRDAGYANGEGLSRESASVLVGNSLTGEFSRASLMRLRWPYVRRVLDAQLSEEGWDAEKRASFLADLEQTYKAPFPEVGPETLAGGLANTIAGRICNYFDFKGGGYTVDGACASSLLAMSHACSALAAGDVDAAIAGGVDLSLDPFELVGFAKTGALADDEMRVFDRRAAGFLPGEGCGMLVLRRLEDARADGQRIYGVIRGWGVSSDGKGGMTRPETAGQILAVQRAYRRAGFGPETVTYFETHGTGTAVGDRTELETLLTARNGASSQAALGFLKANIGHAKAAAGVAGVIKATMAVHSQIIPPAMAGDQPHELLAESGASLNASRRGALWPQDQPVRAGVSAMGFGGVNAHFVLESAAETRRGRLSEEEGRQLRSCQDAELFVLSAPDRKALAKRAEALATRVEPLSLAELTDLAAWLAAQPAAGPARAAIVAARPEELAGKLRRVSATLERGDEARGQVAAGVFLGEAGDSPRIGLLFPGQAAPVYSDGGAWARRFDWIDQAYRDAPPIGCQSAIALASATAARLLAEFGLDAGVALGHSLGELTAMSWAGALEPERLSAMAQTREAIMDRLAEPGGGMLSVSLDPESTRAAIGELPLVVAAENGPKRTVVSGGKAALAQLASRLREQGATAVEIDVKNAFHSPHMEPAAAGFAEWLADQPFAPLAKTMASTVTGETLAANADLRGVLTRQLTEPVRFRQALEHAQSQVDLWLEAGPGRMLTALADQAGVPAIALDAGGDSLRGLLHALGAAYAAGAEPALAKLFADRYVQPYDPDRELTFFTSPCERAAEPCATAPAAADTPEVSDPADPLALVRLLIAEKSALPESEVGDHLRMLNDFHLNSIAVAALIVEAARRLGKPAPASPMDYANASVAEIAEALGSLDETAASDEGGEARCPAGVGAWVRFFRTSWRETPLKTRGPAAPRGAWRVIGPPSPFVERLAACETGAEHAVAVILPADCGAGEAAGWLLAGAQASERRNGPLIVVQEQPGAAAFARAFALEHPKLAVCVVETPLDGADAVERIASESLAAKGFVEARYRDGRRMTPAASHVPAQRRDTALPALAAGDVVLVTGGGKGIVAECALALARSVGLKLILMGRSRSEEDEALSANLDRFRSQGAVFRYVSADVADGEAVSEALAGAQAELGPIVAVIHGAGRNRPMLATALDQAEVDATLAPKLDGLRHALAAVDPGKLKLLCCFGSIIARLGLAGEAHYGFANERMAMMVDDFGRAHPRCRALTLEWSVWSGVGMGERVAQIEQLRRQGIEPITLDDGVAAFLRIVNEGAEAGPLIAAGRFGPPPTLALDLPELPLRRFLQRPRVFYPGVELTVDCELTLDDDPYLRDHVYEGSPIFPTVLGLEAMSQVAMALRGDSASPARIHRLSLQRPILIPENGKTRIRVAALLRRDGLVETLIRCEQTGYNVNHFRAFLDFSALRELEPSRPPVSTPPLAIDPARDLYGPVFFHAGRFRRIAGYRRLGAFHCEAEISAPDDQPWFGRYMPAVLSLGDPGGRDAMLHGVMACIPQASVLPMSAGEIQLHDPAYRGPRFLAARESRRVGDIFTYELIAVDSEGRLLERWRDVKFKRIHDTAPRADWPAALYGPYLERVLHERAPLRVAVERRAGARSARAELALRRLDASVAYKRADGKPAAHDGELSLAHADDLTLCVVGASRLACDLEPARARADHEWRGLLGSRFGLADFLARELDEPLDLAATRVWTAMECLKKAGLAIDSPLAFRAAGPDGWMTLAAGSCEIASLVAPVDDRTLAFAALYIPESGDQGAGDGALESSMLSVG